MSLKHVARKGLALSYYYNSNIDKDAKRAYNFVRLRRLK
jgi:hypothetical protein